MNLIKLNYMYNNKTFKVGVMNEVGASLLLKIKYVF